MVDSDLGAPPESWEVADLDASMHRLLLSSSKKDFNNSSASASSSSANNNGNDQSELGDASASNSALSTANSGGVPCEDLVNSVDQFLREALQNPRERLSSKNFFYPFS